MLFQILTDLQAQFDSPIFYFTFVACNLIAFICWIATLITDNYSHVDRLWSILPSLYAWTFFLAAFIIDREANIYKLNEANLIESFLLPKNSNLLRIFIICVLLSLWSIRLTYNFWRKGGYSLSEEDYRWVHVKKMFNYPESKLTFHLFNFAFTAFFQNWLLLWLALPVWFIRRNEYAQNEPINVLDLILIAEFLIFLLIEIIADQQQWNFQTNKRIYLSNQTKYSSKYTKQEKEDFKRGFLTRGLFKYSRHPNFFAEISIWWIVYAFTLSAQLTSLVDTSAASFPWSNLINYTIFGTLTLTILFHGSTNLTEKISLSKYSEYANYQAKVSRILPFFSSYDSSKKQN